RAPPPRRSRGTRVGQLSLLAHVTEFHSVTTINVSRARSIELAQERRQRRHVPLWGRVRRHAVAYLFLAGAIVCFGFFSWYPIVRETVMSFQKTNFAGDTTWVGLKNFTHIRNDPEFWTAWRASIEFSLLALVFGYAVPFVTAIILNELRHVRGYFRLLVYLPVMM